MIHRQPGWFTVLLLIPGRAASLVAIAGGTDCNVAYTQ
jgi:hypothetical protein